MGISFLATFLKKPPAVGLGRFAVLYYGSFAVVILLSLGSFLGKELADLGSV